MTKLLMTLTISVVASILVIGALIASPDAYSDKKNDNVPDECKCEKPHTLTVLFEAPDGAPIDATYRVEIFKKLDDRDNEEKQLGPDIQGVVDTGNITVFASNFGKAKLESNTAFVVYDETDLENPISLMEIHTSCSKPLFIDMVVDDSETTNNGFKLTVVDGLSGDSPAMTSIPIANPLACEDEKKKSTGSITIKKALTNDNGGTAIFADFEITVTNVETTEEFPVVIDDSGMGVKDVPAGTYTLNETHPDPGEKGTYTTVLIAGDTGCPSMLEEVFTIKKNKNLSCTIYNDDDGSSSGGTGGIIFQNNSLQILIAAPTTLDSCDNPVKPLPCVQIVEQGVLAIVDPILEENTHTIILFSVVEDEINETTGALDPKCTIDRLTHHSNITDETNDNNLTVLLDCPKINSFAKLNVNYVMIDPTM